MSTTRIDLGREYFAGMAAPTEDQAGYQPTVDADGTNFEYRRLAQVTTAASDTWDGSSVAVHVKGSGARSIALPEPTTPTEGHVVTVVDALGNAAAGNITIDPSGSGTINGAGTLVLSTNYASARLQWVSAGVWVRV
jgi:hypothetical protein